MATSLKGANSLGLYGVLGANLALFYTFVKGSALVAGDWSSLTRDLGGILPAGVGLVLQES